MSGFWFAPFRRMLGYTAPFVSYALAGLPAGVEAEIWKIEGVDARADCERIADQCRAGGRDGVVCVVLGRGADDAKVDHWLREAAPVEAYVGFAIGRSIWGDPLAGFIDGSLPREDAAAKVADNYLRFVEVYASAEALAA